MADMKRQEIKRFCVDLDCVADLEARDFDPDDIRDPNKLWDFFRKSAQLEDNELLSVDIRDCDTYTYGMFFQLNTVRLETDEEMEARITKQLEKEKKESEKRERYLEVTRAERYKQYMELKKEFENG